MSNETDAYHALCAYTLPLGDPEFVHQHVVDAFAAQHADTDTKPVGLTMPLVGLFLRAERGASGKEVQRMHMKIARQQRGPWPTFTLPAERGAMTAADVLAATPGPERSRAIHSWAEAVWAAFTDDNRDAVVEFIRGHGIE